MGRARILTGNRLRRDTRGAAVTEFALLAPLFMLVMMGIFDFSMQMYGKQVLSGAVNAAGRASGLEMNNNNQTQLDAAVRAQAQRVFKDATVTFNRRAFRSFEDVGKPEPFTDSNGNGVRDPGECFTDTNGNGAWDVLRGTDGQGGGDQVVLYSATMSYPRLFPLWKMMGFPQTSNITASTVLRNQPFAENTGNNQVICT